MSAKNDIHVVRPSARFCRCPAPVGDPREGQCVMCGHRVEGYEVPSVRFSIGRRDESTTARKRRVYRPAP